MKLRLICLLLLVFGGYCRAETNLAGLKVTFESATSNLTTTLENQTSDALAAYGKALEALLISMKKQGDLRGYLAIDAEKKRFDAGGTPPEPDAEGLNSDVLVTVQKYRDTVSKAKQTMISKNVTLLRRYTGQLESLIKQLMVQDKMDAAKEVQEELEKAKFMLADAESQLPEPEKSAVTPPPKEPVVKKPTEPGRSEKGILTTGITFRDPKAVYKVLELSKSYVAFRGSRLQMGWHTIGSWGQACPQEGWVRTLDAYTGDVTVRIRGAGWDNLHVEMFGVAFQSGSLTPPMPKTRDSTYTLKRSGHTIMAFASAMISSDKEAFWSAEIPVAFRDKPSKIYIGNAGLAPGMMLEEIEIFESKEKASAPVAAPAAVKSDQPWPSDAKVFGGHHYLVVVEKTTWLQAKTACESRGGHLVIITSGEENKFVQELSNGRPLWIGCTDEKKEGDWRWVDGAGVTFTKWLSGQPDNTRGAQHYGFVSRGAWDDDFGDTVKESYVCEWDK